MQVVNSDDLEEILGPRPFKSVEMRNIDKFREGFAKEAAPEQATEGAAADSEAQQQPPVAKS